jgi:hypothetical protein
MKSAREMRQELADPDDQPNCRPTDCAGEFNAEAYAEACLAEAALQGRTQRSRPPSNHHDPRGAPPMPRRHTGARPSRRLGRCTGRIIPLWR